MDLFNLDLLPPEYQKLLPRFGNSLNADSQGTLWLFAGFSQNSLNDIRAFDTKNGSWLPITVDISADTPSARYFHATEMVTNTLYIHGGMNETHIMNDFWKFDLLRKTWERLPQNDPYSKQTANRDLTGMYLLYLTSIFPVD